MIASIYYEYMLSRGYRRSTVRGVRSALGLYGSYIKENFNKGMIEVTGEEIGKYISYILERLAGETAIGRISLLRRFYRYCHKEEYILINPMESIDVRSHHDRIPKYVPDEKVVEELLRQPCALDKEGIRDKAILELMYSSALRRKEVIGLKLGDVDIKERTVQIRKGKGGRGRVVPVGSIACECIEKYLEKVRFKRMKHPEDEHLFLTERGEHFKPHTITELINRYRIRMEEGERITSHSLRHACAVGMLRGGAGIEMVREMLGHKRLTTTQVYTRLYPKDLKDMHKRYHPREKIREKS